MCVFFVIVTKHEIDFESLNFALLLFYNSVNNKKKGSYSP